MSVHAHKIADIAAGVSVAGALASAAHWFFGELSPFQILSVFVGVVAGVMAIISHWKNWRR